MKEDEVLVSPVLDQFDEESEQKPGLEQPIATEDITVQQQSNDQEEEKSETPSNGNTSVINREPVY